MFTMTAIEQARSIRDKRIGVEELTRAYLERIEKFDVAKGLNSVAELNENAIEEARRMDSIKSNRSGAMFGLPVLVKDNIDVSGLHTTAGSLALSDNIATKDAPIIANLRRNGAIILGKANMTEFANYTTDSMPGGYSSRGGSVIHAYDKTKDPGGSSTGSAVAMSAGLCCAAIGTDTSSSIIGCVSENGVTGIRPPHGSLSSEGIVPIARTLDCAGPITRDLNDALLVYSCMKEKGMEPVDPIKPEHLNLAINVFNSGQVSNEELTKYGHVINGLRSNGAQVVEVAQASTKYDRVIMKYEFRHDLEEYLSLSNAKRRTLKEIVEFYEANPDQMMKYGNNYLRGALYDASGKLDDPKYIEALAEQKRLRSEIVESLLRFDACLMIGQTNIMHFIGLPSLALRLGMAEDGTPRGLVLYGVDERRLYAAALTIEGYCGKVTIPKL